MHIFLRPAKVFQKLKGWICLHQHILVHQIDSLSSLVIVNGSEHLKAQIVHHLYAVHDFDVVSQLIVDDTRVFYDCFKVDVVLVALLLIQAAMIIVAAQVIELIDIKGVPLVCDDFEHPLLWLISSVGLALDESADEPLVELVFFDVNIAFLNHIIKKHL